MIWSGGSARPKDLAFEILAGKTWTPKTARVIYDRHWLDEKLYDKYIHKYTRALGYDYLNYFKIGMELYPKKGVIRVVPDLLSVYHLWGNYRLTFYLGRIRTGNYRDMMDGKAVT